MKSLVTGGLGFVGSNLVDMLVSMGDEVWVIDDLSSESSSLSSSLSVSEASLKRY
jgi:UDP-glucose 4-epimerase